MPTPARTSIAGIVAAARGIVETAGADGLTMQRVASTVGVRAPSLYKHVHDRGDLLRLVVDDALRELTAAVDACAATDDPGRDLAALAGAYRRFAHDHSATYGLLYQPLPGDAGPDPSVLAGASARVLRVAGALAGEAQALEAARTVVAWVHGFVSMELAGAFRLGGDVDAAFAYGVERLATALADRRRSRPARAAGRRGRAARPSTGASGGRYAGE